MTPNPLSHTSQGAFGNILCVGLQGEEQFEAIIILQVNCIETALFLEYIFPHFDIALGLCYQL